MYAIAFDLVVADALNYHPKSVTQAYLDIGNELGKFGFERIQGSLHTNEDENMATLFQAMEALKKLHWFGPSVRDLRAFRIEQWSDFTEIVKP
jgi:virulence-associated protein VapD